MKQACRHYVKQVVIDIIEKYKYKQQQKHRPEFSAKFMLKPVIHHNEHKKKQQRNKRQKI